VSTLLLLLLLVIISGFFENASSNVSERAALSATVLQPGL
jgi:hypothetical protein